MAYISREYCNECEQEVDMRNGRCPECSTRQKRQDVAVWQALTIEEKLLDIHKRLLRMENRNDTYA